MDLALPEIGLARGSEAFRIVSEDCLASPGAEPPDPTIGGSSECRDSGRRILEFGAPPPLDYFGEPRDDGSPDVGADEWHPAP